MLLVMRLMLTAATAVMQDPAAAATTTAAVAATRKMGSLCSSALSEAESERQQQLPEVRLLLLNLQQGMRAQLQGAGPGVPQQLL